MHTATGSIWNELHWRKRRLEPSIGELTSDPIIQAVMRRDGVSMAELWQVIEAARRRATSTASSNQGGTNGTGYAPFFCKYTTKTKQLVFSL